MESKKKIYAFASKWLNNFTNTKLNYTTFVEVDMGEECKHLGFIMDCGERFKAKYGDAFNDSEALGKIINEISDIELLGSAIFSQWRYFNHWAYTGAEILKENNRNWFIIALSRLQRLAADCSFAFDGNLFKMRLVSNTINEQHLPDKGDIVEEEIIMDYDGWISHNLYEYNGNLVKYDFASSTKYQIDRQLCINTLNEIADFFRRDFTQVHNNNCGDWMLELTNFDGVVFTYKGSLCVNCLSDHNKLSQLLRKTFNAATLLAFDGNRRYEMINRIVINYYRHTKILINDETTYREYSERIVVDRKMKMIELVSNRSNGMKESHKYEDGDKINKLLDYFSYQDFFVLSDEKLPLSENDNISRDYQITIEYDNGNKKILSGCFDREGLPMDYDDFASKIKAITNTNSFNDILDSSIYDKSRKYDKDYIYCKVIFSSDSSKTYYYYTDDHDIKVGDYVIVEAGRDNIEKCVKVVDVECFKARFLPRPIQTTKKIIRKCYRDEIDFDDYIDDDDDYFDIDEYDVFQKRFKD